ncbi:MAG: DUF2207 family protein, partial [Acidimicrobiales bacterium]
LAGPESPAVVSLLVNRWEVGREAVPATLLDLAARKALDVERVAPERYALRVRRSEPDGLADYERQVLDHVRGLASDTVVPCEALTTGPDDQSAGWWRRFQKAVVSDARRQGLSRARWGAAAIVVLGIAAVPSALLAAAAFVSIPESESSSASSSSEDDNPVVGAIVLGAIGWSALMAVPFWLRAERDTPKGREAAARWLGVQEYLDESESFDRAPPTAVAIWDRYLAYGAAMGVAAGAVRALPLGSESEKVAWSAYGGHWHVVRVRYPKRFPPGWGAKPWVVAAKGLLFLAATGFVVSVLGSALVGAARDFFDMAHENDWRLAATIVTAVLGVLGALAAATLLRSVVMLVYGVIDLFAKDAVEGLVVRLRNGYVAVDDGRSRRVRAWKVEPLKLGGVSRGTVVRATVSRRLRYVIAIPPVDERPRQAGLADAPIDEPA